MDDLAAFAEWLISFKLIPNTVRNYLSSVKTLYLWWHKPHIVKLFKTDTWSLTLRAINNTTRPTTSGRTAVIIQDLLALVGVCSSSVALLPLRVGLTFGFFGFLRVSNLAPQKLSDWDESRHTTWGDVEATEEGVLLTLRWSKSRQHSAHPATLPLPALGSSPLCPLRAWLLYRQSLSKAQLPIYTPLLVSTADPPGVPLTIPQFRSAFHAVCGLAGLAHRAYTPHSLRRGGATLAYQAGVDIAHIKTHATWLSEAVDAYLLSQPKFTTPVAKTFGRLLRHYKK